MICLSYKYLLVVIFSRICHGQVGRSTEGIVKQVKRNPSVQIGSGCGELVNNYSLCGRSQVHAVPITPSLDQNFD